MQNCFSVVSINSDNGTHIYAAYARSTDTSISAMEKYLLVGKKQRTEEKTISMERNIIFKRFF